MIIGEYSYSNFTTISNSYFQVTFQILRHFPLNHDYGRKSREQTNRANAAIGQLFFPPWQRNLFLKVHLSMPYQRKGWLGPINTRTTRGYEWFKTCEPRKKPSYLPLYWLVIKDPYNGSL